MTMTRKNRDELHRVELTLNGKPRVGYAEPRMLLSDFLRHELGCYGVHVGCEHGVCGACTIICNGSAQRSCTQYAVQADGAELRTVEGLGEPGELSLLQDAFRRHHALQCGFCTAGVLMSATAFLEDAEDPSDSEIREMLSGHICRCTDYHGMVQAVAEVARAHMKKT